MIQDDKKTELNLYFIKLQPFYDTTNYKYLQNLVIYLSAKQIIEAREKKQFNDKTLNEMMNSLLKVFEYEKIINKYLDAAKNLIPEYSDQFDFSTIQLEVWELSTTVYGLEKCYAFLKLKEFNNTRETILIFNSNIQTNYIYNIERFEKVQSFTKPQIIYLYQDEGFFEFEMLETSTNSKIRVNELKFESETSSFIWFSNSEVKIQLNLEAKNSNNTIVSVQIIDIKGAWIIDFEK